MPRLQMTLLNKTEWEIAAGLAVTALVAARGRMACPAQAPHAPMSWSDAPPSSSLSQGALSTACCSISTTSTRKTRRKLTMLLFNYRIGGVDYECSQDITAMLEWSKIHRCVPDFPAPSAISPATRKTASSLRKAGRACAKAFRSCPSFEDPDPLDTSHLSNPAASRPGRCAPYPPPVTLDLCMSTRRPRAIAQTGLSWCCVSRWRQRWPTSSSHSSRACAPIRSRFSPNQATTSPISWLSCSASPRSTSSRAPLITQEPSATSAPGVLAAFINAATLDRHLPVDRR